VEIQQQTRFRRSFDDIFDGHRRLDACAPDSKESAITESEQEPRKLAKIIAEKVSQGHRSEN
jgi:hypothetical protein